jgi:hypothetical protein
MIHVPRCRPTAEFRDGSRNLLCVEGSHVLMPPHEYMRLCRQRAMSVSPVPSSVPPSPAKVVRWMLGEGMGVRVRVTVLWLCGGAVVYEGLQPRRRSLSGVSRRRSRRSDPRTAGTARVWRPAGTGGPRICEAAARGGRRAMLRLRETLGRSRTSMRKRHLACLVPDAAHGERRWGDEPCGIRRRPRSGPLRSGGSP